MHPRLAFSKAKLLPKELAIQEKKSKIALCRKKEMEVPFT